ISEDTFKLVPAYQLDSVLNSLQMDFKKERVTDVIPAFKEYLQSHRPTARELEFAKRLDLLIRDAQKEQLLEEILDPSKKMKYYPKAEDYLEPIDEETATEEEQEAYD